MARPTVAAARAAAAAALSSTGRGQDEVLMALLVDCVALSTRDARVEHLRSVLNAKNAQRLADAFDQYLEAGEEAPPSKRARVAEPAEEEPPVPWLQEGASALPGDAASALSEELVLFEAWCGLRPAERAARDGLMRRVTAAARAALGAGVEARPFGSYSAGLATFSSDVDVGLHGAGLSAGATGLRPLARHLDRTGWASEVDFRSRARVPVIAFVDRVSGCSCDISLAVGELQSGESTTAAVVGFASEWPLLFRPLLCFLKLALEEAELNKPFTGGLGSFKLAVLLACYLEDARAPSLGGCLLGFLTFVARRFDFESVITFGGIRADFSSVFNSSALCLWCADAARSLASSPSSSSASRLARVINAAPLARARTRSAARAAAAAAAAAAATGAPAPAPSIRPQLPPAPPLPARVRELHVFDLDGTLFVAPGPTEGRAMLQRAGVSWPHKGWWSEPGSLLPPLPIAPGPALPAFAAACARAASQPDSGILLVMLSGRRAALAPAVRGALAEVGAPHAAHVECFAPAANAASSPRSPLSPGGGGDLTLTFKLQSLASALETFGSSALREVHLYEDRAEHAEAFQRFADQQLAQQQQLTFTVHRVDASATVEEAVGAAAAATAAAAVPAAVAAPSAKRLSDVFDGAAAEREATDGLPRLACDGYARLLLPTPEEARGTPASWREARLARDSGADGALHHLTLLTRAETAAFAERYGVRSDAEIWELLWAQLRACGGLSGLEMGRVGVAADAAAGTASAFLTATWKAGDALRSKLGLPPRQFHVSLGFLGADTHGVEKGPRTHLRGLGRDVSAAALRKAILNRADELLLGGSRSASGEAEEGSLEYSDSDSDGSDDSRSSSRS